MTATVHRGVPPDAVAPSAGVERTRSTAWWGMVLTIATEAMIFAALLSSYFFLRAGADAWPPPGIEEPKLARISAFTVILLASSVPVVLAERSIERGDNRATARWLALGWSLGAVFLAHQAFEYHELTFGWGDGAYASLFYTTTGLHGLHLLVGLLMGLVVLAKVVTGRIGARRHRTLEVFALYWHFVDVVWIAVFSSLYVSVALA